MVDEYTGTVNKFEVRDKQPRGRIEVNVTAKTSGPLPLGINTFKLDEDSDTTFAGMASICALVYITGTPVKIRIVSGANDEIDELELF
jgi:hypothetical protein